MIKDNLFIGYTDSKFTRRLLVDTNSLVHPLTGQESPLLNGIYLVFSSEDKLSNWLSGTAVPHLKYRF